MVEVWKDEGGKEDSEGRREWERRWREVGDVLNEEDVMETSIMHLCIPDYWKKEKNGVIIPSECSYNALTHSLSLTSHNPPSFSINGGVPSSISFDSFTSIQCAVCYAPLEYQ